MSLRLKPRDHAVVVECERGEVYIDGSAHALFARGPGGEVWEAGASRAGLQRIVDSAAGALGLDDEGAEEVRAAALAALRRAAAHRGLDLGAQGDEILRARATPLPFSAPFLASRFLRDDALQFAACRAAIAYLEGAPEDDLDEPADLAGARALVERLEGWRALYRAGGTSKKLMNRALSIIDHAYDFSTVWGLRRVKLTRTPETRVEVELLGALGAHPRFAELENHVRLVERTAPVDLELALDTLARYAWLEQLFVARSPAHLAAELLAWISVGPRTGLRRSLETAAAEAQKALRDETPTARPPIPLPASRSIHFLDTVQKIVDEGRRMGHCVGTRAPLAVRGDAYIFHIAMGPYLATAQLNGQGRLVEIRGPENRHTPACDVGGRVLREWGRELAAARARADAQQAERESRLQAERLERAWLEGLALDDRVWLGSRPAPRGARALRTVRDVVAPYERYADPARRASFRAWVIGPLRRAREGKAWLIAREVAGEAAIAVLDAEGRVVDRFRWA